MIDEFKLVRMNSSLVRDPEMISKYASLGYFHYKYICSLDPMNSCENIVKDNGVVRGKRFNLPEGSYITLSVANFSLKRKSSYMFHYPQHRMQITMSELILLMEYVHKGSNIDVSDCFVKFDVYTVVY